MNDGMKLKTNDLAWMSMGKNRKLVRITCVTTTGVVVQVEEPPKSGLIYMPLIVGGKNVHEFEKVKQRTFEVKEIGK